jgi:hypothetical protein
MSSWKPEITRAALLRTGITREHAWAYEPDKPMGNWAAGMVDCMVSAALVGLLDQMVDLCPRAMDWIDRALARNERSGPNDDNTFYLQSLLQSKAMAIWLNAHANAQEIWADAFDRLLGLLLREVKQTRSRLNGELIDDLMACGLQGGRWAQAMAAYDQLVGAKSRRSRAWAKPPSTGVSALPAGAGVALESRRFAGCRAAGAAEESGRRMAAQRSDHPRGHLAEDRLLD